MTTAVSLENVQHTDFLRALEHREVQCAGLRAMLRAEKVATLSLPSGRIVAFDPTYASPAPPFSESVEPGSYPVFVGVAAFPETERVTCAVLRLSEEPAIRWEPIDVYGVDAGLGCFVDAAALGAYYRCGGPRLIAEALGSLNFGEFVRGEMPSNMVVFSTGVGDGAYPNYWGFGASGRRVALATDFLILVEPAFEDDAFPDFQDHPEGMLVAASPTIRVIANEGQPGFEVEGEAADEVGFVLQDADGAEIDCEVQTHDMRPFGGALQLWVRPTGPLPPRYTLVLRRQRGIRPL